MGLERAMWERAAGSCDTRTPSRSSMLHQRTLHKGEMAELRSEGPCSYGRRPYDFATRDATELPAS